jgi:hypothetical protein
VVLNNCYGPKKCDLYDNENHLVETYIDPVPDGFAYQIQHSINCFKQGKLQSDLIPWRDTIECAGIFDKLRKQWVM